MGSEKMTKSFSRRACPGSLLLPMHRPPFSAGSGDLTSVALFLCAPKKQLSLCQRHETLFLTEVFYISRRASETQRGGYNNIKRRLRRSPRSSRCKIVPPRCKCVFSPQSTPRNTSDRLAAGLVPARFCCRCIGQPSALGPLPHPLWLFFSARQKKQISSCQGHESFYHTGKLYYLAQSLRNTERGVQQK